MDNIISSVWDPLLSYMDGTTELNSLHCVSYWTASGLCEQKFKITPPVSFLTQKMKGAHSYEVKMTNCNSNPLVY